MWWFILIPILWIIISKIIWHNEISFKECMLHFVSVVPVTAIIFGVAYNMAISDTQLIHGSVIDKVRDNDSHQESYSCNCHNVCSGSGSSRSCSNVCQTCWRTVYTVDWYLKTSIGNISLDSDRSYSATVWLTDDPSIYTKSYVGEPCAKYDSYKNYVKGSPDSLFNQSSYVIKNYPQIKYPEIFGIYKVNNVISNGLKIDLQPYEDAVSDKLKIIGSKKQVNIVLILTSIQDKNYRYSVEKQWIGGKKNDVVIIVGIDGNKITWADSFTFGLTQGNHFLASQIRDSLTGKELSVALINEQLSMIESQFKRKPMADFKYLSTSIKPSTELMIFVFFLQLIANIGITFYNIKHEYI